MVRVKFLRKTIAFNNLKCSSYYLRPRLYLAKNYTKEKAGNDKGMMKQTGVLDLYNSAA